MEAMIIAIAFLIVFIGLYCFVVWLGTNLIAPFNKDKNENN